jgi:hypothetical protein
LPNKFGSLDVAESDCRLVWNKNYMLSEISVKVFRSGRKLVGPAETDIA